MCTVTGKIVYALCEITEITNCIFLHNPSDIKPCEHLSFMCLGCEIFTICYDKTSDKLAMCSQEQNPGSRLQFLLELFF